MIDYSSTELRIIALQHACHDYKGQADVATIIAQAEAYLQFLDGRQFSSLANTQQAADQLQSAAAQQVQMSLASPYYRR